MKKVLFALCLIILAAAPGLFSLSLELTAGLGNFSYDQDRTTALSDDAVKGSFSPNFFPLALARFSGDYRNIAYSAGFEKDPLAKNRVFMNVKTDFDFFFLEAGPYVGLFNTKQLPFNPGLSASMGFSFPGIVFINVSGASTLGPIMDVTGYYYQNKGGLSAGFWVPYVVCSVNISSENFTTREKDTLLIKNSLAKYFFRADVFTKNIPYTIRVDLGFENLSRSYTSQDISGGSLIKDSETDEFKSIFMGLELIYTFTPAFKILLGGEMPVYSWGNRPMQNPPKGVILFEARAGIIISWPAKE